jgi:RNA polymerase sigma-70 factor, ECF subfamily
MTRAPIQKVSPNEEFPWDWADARRACLEEARRVLRSHDAAEEVAQLALIRAWRRRGTCKRPEQPRGWLVRIARNEALRHLEGERRRRESPFEEELFVAPDEQLDWMLADLDLDRLVANLSAADRELVRLRYVEDLTHSQVADCLGVPEGTAKVRLHRLRGRLRGRLGGRSEEGT